MARPAWYNENSGREYPFVHERIPWSTWNTEGRGTYAQWQNYDKFLGHTEALLDFGCVMGIQAEFVEGVHSVWLQSVWNLGNYIEFEFRSDAPGLAHYKLVFTREVDDEGYEVNYASATPEDDYSWSANPYDEFELCNRLDGLWEGFLATGDIAELAAAFSNKNTFGDAGNLKIEPSLIQNLSQSYLRSLTVINTNRTRATNLDECRPLCWPNQELDEQFIVGSCLEGNIRFSEGYNCRIEEDQYTSTLIFHAELGQGAGEARNEVPLYSGEGKPQGRSFYDGALGCNEVVRSINGIEGPHVEVAAGQGIEVDTYPSSHLIIVRVNMQDLTGCFDQEASTSLDQLEYDADPCECGPL